MNKIKKIVNHLKEDMKTFDREKNDDKDLIKMLKDKKVTAKKRKQDIISDEMHEFKKGKLHSGSKKGPIVKNPKQAIAIALNVAKKKRK